MAFALSHQSPRRPEAARSATMCRVHTCLRCRATIDSTEPCTIVRTTFRVCAECAGQQQAAGHLPVSRTPWGTALARAHRV